MEFLKKHYEKLILSVVLLGMAVAAALLPLKVGQVRQELQQATLNIERARIKPLPELDLSTNNTVLRRVRNPGPLTLDAPGHNLFNPIQWKKKPDGTPVPSEQFGLSALVVTNISPLYLRIQFRGVRNYGSDVRYDFMVTREAATNNAARGPLPSTLAAGARTDLFTVKDVDGPKDNPQGIIIEMTGARQPVMVTRDQPYTEVQGYTADLLHTTENKVFLRQRQGQKLSFGGENYNIIAINERDVTLRDSRTQKQTTISLKSAP